MAEWCCRKVSKQTSNQLPVNQCESTTQQMKQTTGKFPFWWMLAFPVAQTGELWCATELMAFLIETSVGTHQSNKHKQISITLPVLEIHYSVCHQVFLAIKLIQSKQQRFSNFTSTWFPAFPPLSKCTMHLTCIWGELERSANFCCVVSHSLLFFSPGLLIS